jgi:hypothetical protein
MGGVLEGIKASDEVEAGIAEWQLFQLAVAEIGGWDAGPRNLKKSFRGIETGDAGSEGVSDLCGHTRSAAYIAVASSVGDESSQHRFIDRAALTFLDRGPVVGTLSP